MINIDRILSRAASVALVVVLAVAGVAAYRFARSQVEAEVYRERLGELSQGYEQLRRTYNQAVRRTAVTELLVEDGELCVVIRTAEGVQKTIPTPFDPSREVYVDYIVRDGRLWVRRVFDDRTAPGEALLIDPSLGEVDWDAPGTAFGKAAYRRLSEGRWIVSVTGDGSLGLTKVGPEDRVELTPPPAVRDYEQVEAQVQDRLRGVGAGEVVRRLVR